MELDLKKLCLVVHYKRRTIGEVYQVPDSDQWGMLFYKTNYSCEGLANTTVMTEIADVVEHANGGYILREEDLKHIKLTLKLE